MHSVKINRLELLDIVRANMLKHVEEYNEAVGDYKVLLLKTTAFNVKVAKTGDMEKFKSMKTLPQVPTSYEDSYKRAIRMLELSVEDVIEVEEDVFNQLVLDEWSWKRGFAATTASYKMSF